MHAQLRMEIDAAAFLQGSAAAEVISKIKSVRVDISV